MEATTAAVTRAIEPAVGAIARDIDFWIRLVSVFSTAFAVFIAMVAIIFAVLTFSLNEQRKRAEKELEALTNIRKDSESLHGVIKKLSGQAKLEIQGISKITTKAKINEIELKALKEKSQSLARTLNSLATVSSLSPSVSPSASPSVPKKGYSSILDLLKGGDITKTAESKSQSSSKDLAREDEKKQNDS